MENTMLNKPVLNPYLVSVLITDCKMWWQRRDTSCPRGHVPGMDKKKYDGKKKLLWLFLGVVYITSRMAWLKVMMQDKIVSVINYQSILWKLLAKSELAFKRVWDSLQNGGHSPMHLQFKCLKPTRWRKGSSLATVIIAWRTTPQKL